MAAELPATQSVDSAIGPARPAGWGWYESKGKVFPSEDTVEEAVRVLLRHVGEDPDRDGLKGTPNRVVRAWIEMTSGYGQDPAAILGTVFEEPYDEIILVKDIPFASTCEHHLLPFVGTVDVGYLPGKVVGLSKVARLVDCFSRRLQIQERLTREIAEMMETHLSARGVAVVVRASHSCMSCRGIKKSSVEMITSCMLGIFRTEPSARLEFFGLSK